MNYYRQFYVMVVCMCMLFGLSTCMAQKDSYHDWERVLQNPTRARIFVFDSTYTSISSRIGECKNLEDVRFEYTPIESLPDEFYDLPLKKVVFVGTTGLNIVEVIKKLRRCKQLTFLGFSGLGLTVLPSEIGELSTLQTLGLWNNELQTLPIEVGNLINLKALALSGNKITVFPTSVAKLEDLRDILLDDNQLTRLPVNLLQIPHVTGIGLARNPGLGSGIKEVLQWLSQYDLAELGLNNCNISVLPPEIELFPNLDLLSLDENKLSVLPEEILKLKKITFLYFGNNSLSFLPEDIGDLTHLKYLDVSFNKLKRLPRSLGKIKTTLVDLTIGNNLLSEEEKEWIRKTFKKNAHL